MFNVIGSENVAPGAVAQDAPPARFPHVQLAICTTTLSSTRAVPAKVTWFPNSDVCVAWNAQLGRFPGLGSTMLS